VKWPTTLGVCLMIVTAADLAVPFLEFREVEPLSPAFAMLARLPAAPLVEFPFWSSGVELHGHARYMRYSTAHWMPLINGYSDYLPPDFVESAETLRGFPSRDAFARLAPKHARYALFHMLVYGEEDRARVLAGLTEFGAYLRPLYIDEETRLYEIVGFP
jgi:hypothetical protein